MFRKSKKIKLCLMEKSTKNLLVSTLSYFKGYIWNLQVSSDRCYRKY